MRYTIEMRDRSVAVEVDPQGPGRYRVKLGDAPARIVEADVKDGLVHLLNGTSSSHSFRVGATDDAVEVHEGGLRARLTTLDPRAARLRARGTGARAGSGDRVRSPMPGRVVQVLVAEGDAVQPGQGVVIIEAMKMENELRAEIAGTVAKVHVKVDDRVEGNADLITLTPAEG